jgi:hypothetical protein
LVLVRFRLTFTVTHVCTRLKIKERIRLPFPIVTVTFGIGWENLGKDDSVNQIIEYFEEP